MFQNKIVFHFIWSYLPLIEFLFLLLALFGRYSMMGAFGKGSVVECVFFPLVTALLERLAMS